MSEASKSPDSLDQSPVAFVMDGGGIVVEWSAAAEVVFGWLSPEAIGRKLSALIIPEEHREAHEQGLKRFLEAGKGRLLDRPLVLSVVHRDGRRFNAEFKIGAEAIADGYRFPTKLRAIPE
jgi:PAS domain S-box-containing protein